MPAPNRYDIGQVDVGNYFDAFRQGRADRLAAEGETRNRQLSEYLPGALEGDEGMRKSAMAATVGDPNMTLQLSQALQGVDQQKLAQAREMNGKIASLAAWADTPDKWTVALADAKKIDPNIGDIPFEQRGAVIAKAQTVSEQLDQVWKQKSYDLDASRTKAQNTASYASADASRASASRTAASGKAPQGYAWSPDGSSLVALPGGPADPMRKLTETQSKDLGYFNRGAKANEEMTSDRLDAMISTPNTLGRAVAGNVGQSALSRQGMQASKNFVAALLRKDTGAAVTPQEFDFYGDIFLPQFGDDDQTKQLKAAARVEALNTIRQGLGAADVLALPAVQAISGGGGASPQSQPAPQASTPPNMGAVINRGGEKWRFLGGNPADKSRWRREP